MKRYWRHHLKERYFPEIRGAGSWMTVNIQLKLERQHWQLESKPGRDRVWDRPRHLQPKQCWPKSFSPFTGSSLSAAQVHKCSYGQISKLRQVQPLTELMERDGEKRLAANDGQVIPMNKLSLHKQPFRNCLDRKQRKLSGKQQLCLYACFQYHDGSSSWRCLRQPLYDRKGSGLNYSCSIY